MKIQDANKLIQNIGLGDTTTYLHQLIFDENDSNDTKIVLYFIMHRLGL